MNGSPAYILVNPNCHQGRGWKRWLSVKTEVMRRIPGATEVITDKTTDVADLIRQLGQGNSAVFISAGGDGTVHNLVNSILSDPNAMHANHRIGAIGLGSSNDFLKPFTTLIGKIPVRISLSGAPILHDAGKAVFLDENGNSREKYFIINASFGATAEGNWNFNHPGSVLKWLKKTNTSAAISFTAIRTLLSYRNKKCRVIYNEFSEQIAVSNINILKIPYVSGSLHYRQPVRPDDGQLGLHICRDMNRRELFSTLFKLEKGNFEPGEKRISLWIKNFSLESESPVVFECDGETEKIFKATLSIVPGALSVLQS